MALRAIGLATLSALMASAILSRCASGRVKSAPAEAPAAATASSIAPAAPAAPPATPAHSDRIDFNTHILPVLQEKCSPCHFAGGRMYDRLPFDQEGTILLLGTNLFTRLREPLDQELIRAYLEQP
ncbi:MAG: hypothetical protein AAB249_03885 [Acidobacteriota bacterium]|jgi:hypothetical protein